MGIIHHSDNRDLEISNLEAHVLLCQQRHESLVDRITRIEAKVDDSIAKTATHRQLVIGWTITIFASMIGGASTLIVKFLLN